MNELDGIRPTKRLAKDTILWLLFGVLVVLILIILAYALGWITTPLRLTDPERLENISREANQAWEALEAQLASVENINDKMVTMKQLYGEDMGTWPQGKDDEYLQLQAQKVNLINAYNQQCAAYKAKWANEWWELSAPKDLPRTCETYN